MERRATGFKLAMQLLAMSALALLLNSCNNTQAPVLEQGERQVLRPPIIVDSSTPDSSFRAANRRPAIVSSAASASVRSAPAAASSRSRSNNSVSATHRVRNGDTLFSIAFQHDLDFRSLAIANGLNPPYTIFVDQKLNLDINNISRVRSRSASDNLGTAVSNNSVASI